MNTFSNTFIYAQNGFVGCSGKQFLFLRGQDFIKAKNKTDIELDAIVLSGHKKVDLRVLNEAFRFRHVIIDGSVPRWKQSHCEQAAKQLGIPCHTTRSDGAYVLEL